MQSLLNYDLTEYLPIIVFIGLATVLASVMILIPGLFAARKPDQEKNSQKYELKRIMEEFKALAQSEIDPSKLNSKTIALSPEPSDSNYAEILVIVRGLKVSYDEKIKCLGNQVEKANNENSALQVELKNIREKEERKERIQ